MKSLSDLLSYKEVYVDGMNLAARSFHGMKGLSYKGKPTGMLYGVVRLVLDYIGPNRKIVFLWEGRGSIRKQKDKDYKSKRIPLGDRDDGFLDSLATVKAILPALGVDQVRCDGLEADDLAYYYASVGNHPILLVSNDSDWLAFASGSPRVDVLSGSLLLTERMVREKEGLSGLKLTELKILKGDPSDNVSGIPRLPTKLAQRMVAESEGDFYTFLKSIGEHKWAKVLEDNQDVLVRNMLLTMPLPIQGEGLKVTHGARDKGIASQILKEHGMELFVSKVEVWKC